MRKNYQWYSFSGQMKKKGYVSRRTFRQLYIDALSWRRVGRSRVPKGYTPFFITSATAYRLVLRVDVSESFRDYFKQGFNVYLDILYEQALLWHSEFYNALRIALDRRYKQYVSGGVARPLLFAVSTHTPTLAGFIEADAFDMIFINSQAFKTFDDDERHLFVTLVAWEFFRAAKLSLRDMNEDSMLIRKSIARWPSDLRNLRNKLTPWICPTSPFLLALNAEINRREGLVAYSRPVIEPKLQRLKKLVGLIQKQLIRADRSGFYWSSYFSPPVANYFGAEGSLHFTAEADGSWATYICEDFATLVKLAWKPTSTGGYVMYQIYPRANGRPLSKTAHPVEAELRLEVAAEYFSALARSLHLPDHQPFVLGANGLQIMLTYPGAISEPFVGPLQPFALMNALSDPLQTLEFKVIMQRKLEHHGHRSLPAKNRGGNWGTDSDSDDQAPRPSPAPAFGPARITEPENRFLNKST